MVWYRGVDPGDGSLDPIWKYIAEVRVCLTSPPPKKNVTCFHSELLLDNSTSFTSSRLKDLCQKWKLQLLFRGAYSLSGTGIVECSEIIDVWCNLKQFDDLTWLTLTPHIYDNLPPLLWYAPQLVPCVSKPSPLFLLTRRKQINVFLYSLHNILKKFYPKGYEFAHLSVALLRCFGHSREYMQEGSK